MTIKGVSYVHWESGGEKKTIEKKKKQKKYLKQWLRMPQINFRHQLQFRKGSPSSEFWLLQILTATSSNLYHGTIENRGGKKGNSKFPLSIRCSLDHSLNQKKNKSLSILCPLILSSRFPMHWILPKGFWRRKKW